MLKNVLSHLKRYKGSCTGKRIKVFHSFHHNEDLPFEVGTFSRFPFTDGHIFGVAAASFHHFTFHCHKLKMQLEEARHGKHHRASDIDKVQAAVIKRPDNAIPTR